MPPCAVASRAEYKARLNVIHHVARAHPPIFTENWQVCSNNAANALQNAKRERLFINLPQMLTELFLLSYTGYSIIQFGHALCEYAKIGE